MHTHNPIYKSYFNNYKNLFDKIVIQYDPPNFSKLWSNIIKNIDITINISTKNEQFYHQFDKISFTDENRKNYHPEFNNEFLHIFHILPLEYIQQNLNYIFALEESIDIDFRIDIDIFFNESPPMDISFVEVDNHIIQEHKNHWINDRDSEKLI